MVGGAGRVEKVRSEWACMYIGSVCVHVYTRMNEGIHRERDLIKRTQVIWHIVCNCEYTNPSAMGWLFGQWDDWLAGWAGVATAGLGWAALAGWLTHWLAWLAGGLAGNFCGSSCTVPLCLHCSLPGWCTSCMHVRQVEKNDVHRNRCKDGLRWQQAGLRRSGWLARVAWAGLGWAGG